MKKKRKAKQIGHYVLAGVLGYDMSYYSNWIIKSNFDETQIF